jgi:predicted alpha/beta hydrolase
LDYNQVLSKVDCPVLGICFKDDRYAPLRAVRSTVANFNGGSLELVHFDGHDFTSVDHFKWAQQPETVCRKITAWLATK